MGRCARILTETSRLTDQHEIQEPIRASMHVRIAKGGPLALFFEAASNIFTVIVALLVGGSAYAAPPLVNTNPETERLVKERMVKYERGCARTTGPADLYTCHHKHWEGLATDVQGYAFQIQRSRPQANPLWYAEFERRYITGADYRNCIIRFGEYNPMAAPEITACYLREYAYLEVMVDRHNKGTWKPSTPANATPSDAQRKKADAYIRGLKETNSEKYEGD